MNYPVHLPGLFSNMETMKAWNEALKKYAAQYGPLTIDTGDDTCSRQWDWVMQPWPWEGVC